MDKLFQLEPSVSQLPVESTGDRGGKNQNSPRKAFFRQLFRLVDDLNSDPFRRRSPIANPVREPFQQLAHFRSSTDPQQSSIMARRFKERNARKVDSSTLPGDGTRQPSRSGKYVVAIDFGTAFSGFAFAKRSDIESGGEDGIQIHDNWPGQGQAGAKAYCKTQTSVWYMPGPKPGTFELKGWGWSGYLAYKERRAGMTLNESRTGQQSTIEINSPPRISARYNTALPHKSGYFIKDFKLGLAGLPQDLPLGLTLERVISDYLRELTTYVLKELLTKYGNDAASQREIQYIVTVPAMWTLQMRQRMQSCAEMAGMVGGILCKDSTAASPYDLIIVTEPEAAAVQVYKTLKTVSFTNGDRFLMVDVGGGTTDIILHEKIGSTTRNNIRVKEVSASDGVPVGGIHVDEQFFNFMRETIGPFSSFQRKEPRQIFEVSRWWNDVKCDFNGDQNNLAIPIPGKLAEAWKRFDLGNGRGRRPDYYSLRIGRKAIKRIFDPVIENILNFIQSRLVPNLRAIFVVGGFSESPYLQDRIKKAFSSKTETTIFMRNAGSAVVRGAALYGVAKEWIDLVSTRIAPRTIGWDVARPFINKKHRRDYLVDDHRQALCDNLFGVLIRRGQEIPVNYVCREILRPLYRRGKEDTDDLEVNLYETRAKNPLYVTDKGVRKLTTCCISVPRKEILGRTPKLVLLVHFGTLIKASVLGENFSGQTVCMPPVKMKWTSPDGI